MIRKSTNTRVQSGKNQNVVAKGLAGFIHRITRKPKADPNRDKLLTVFTGKNKQEIIDLIGVSNDVSADSEQGNIGGELIMRLTDLFFFYQNQDEVAITPSLYLQYLNFKTIEELVATRTQVKELALILSYIRYLMYHIIKQSECQTTESEKVSPSDVFLRISLPAITRLKRLEGVKSFGGAKTTSAGASNRISTQKEGNKRIALADYRFAKLSKKKIIDIRNDELDLLFKHFKKSTFLGAVGSIGAEHAVFEDCILDKANFHYSWFEWTKFINTSIKNAKFADSKFHNVDFSGLNNSESAVFVNCRFHMCKMIGCKALFIDCDFDDCENEGLRIINNDKKDKTERQQYLAKTIKPRTYIDDVNAVFASESSSAIIEMLAGMIEGNNSNEMANGRTIAFIAAITKPLTYLRDNGHIQLSPAIYNHYMELSEVEALLFKHDGKYGPEFDDVLRPLLFYVKTIPDYDASRINDGQSKQTNEQFGFIAMQVVKILNRLESM
ncbi:MAG: hypothetical protein J6N72_07910 [Psychrobacter sp.]|nr:hypothetical protein [Psychrobacter sp.]